MNEGLPKKPIHSDDNTELNRLHLEALHDDILYETKKLAEYGAYIAEVVTGRPSNAQIEMEMERVRALQMRSAENIEQNAKTLEEDRREKTKESITDPLTHVLNRRGFEFRLTQALGFDARMVQRGQKEFPIALALIDLDGFKTINDVLGHKEGDEYLKAIAEALSGYAKRSLDAVGRYGGDEFTMLLFDNTEEVARAILELVQERIRALSETIQEKIAAVQGNAVSQTVGTASIGFVMFDPTQHKSTEDMFASADKAMYQAKQEGKDSVARR